MIDKTSIIKTLQLESMTHSDQMEVLDSIEKTIKESKVRQKEQLQTNVDFVVQALKGIKQDLEERFSRLDNKLVGKVDNILSGKDGLPGKDGIPGRDGRAGRDGAQGADGKNGEDGKDGIGVSKAKVDIDGELVITLTDGRIIEAGKVFTKAVAEKIRVFSNSDNRIPELVGQSGKILSNDGVNVIWTYNVPITIKDEGTSITTAVKSINFVGATVTATESNEDVTVNVSAGTGTVTSVALSGGTTGLTASGSPITTTGTITLGGTLAVANGGTGATTAGNALTNLGAYPSANPSGFTSNTGTVTSVATTAGTGISVTGSPITTSGTLTITNTAPDQTVSLTGAGTTSISGTYPNFTVTSNDSTLGTVTSVAATAGTGISITGSPITSSGTLNITNTAPDQTVMLTASTGISTSGTYPNFTITNSAPDQTVALTASTGISTSGTYPNFTITNSAPDQTVSLTGAGTTSITGTYPNFTITSNDSATGTVTSVGLSGGTTGLTVTGSPITTSGTITLGGTLDVDNGGTGQTSYTNGQLLIGNTTGNTLTKTTLTAGSGIAITNGGGSISIAATNSGTVTAVTGTSPVVSSGGATPAISLASGYGDTQNPYASKTANFVLGAPNGSAGVPTFRAIVAADIPALNQNTTGTASNVTGTVAVVNGGTGTTTPSLVAGTNITISGSFPNQTINASSSSGTVTSVAAITLGTTGTDLSSTVANGTTTPVITLNVPTASAVNRGALSSADWTTFNNKGSGTVTSVTATSPVASSGGATPAISLSSGYGDTLNPYASKTANFVLASPNGTAGVPTFRAVVATDIPTLNQNTTGSAATLTTGRTIAITGDLAYTSPSFNGSANVTAAGTLATVNANVGSFTYASITVNGKGLITAASSGTAPVTSVTATSPVASTGGATPVISMPAATTTVSGYLTSTDWTTFNNKGSGTVTSVSGTAGRITSTGGATPVLDLASGIATAGTTGSVSLIPVVTIDTYGRVTSITTAANPQGTVTSVTGTSPVVSSGGATPTISMAAATTSVSGYLTSTDWNTFNGKGSGTVTSVAATVPTFLSVSGSPVTTSGTLAITLSGTALPVVNGGTGVTTSTGSGNVVLSTSPSLTTPVLGTPTSGTLSNCTVDGTDAVGFRNVPVNSQSAAYTLVLADSGKTILHPSSDANARTFTIPSNASVAYPIGTVITFINMTSQVVTIAITTDTMNLSPAGTTGSRSLAQYGSATALKITSTNWLISGSGLT